MNLRNRSAAALAAVALAFPLLAAVPAAAAEDPPYQRPARLATLRICDLTACYISWRVIDSDSDGVCDADELMAGTDPHDPDSFPRLEVVVELATAHKLPSFQNGRGSFLVLPAELLELREKATNLPTIGVFAMPVRKNALERMGVDLGQFEQLRLSVERDGFAIGLGKIAQDAGGGGISQGYQITIFEGRYQGYEPGVTVKSPAAYGGIDRVERLWIWDDADHRVFYNDGSHDDVSFITDGTSRQHYNADGSKGNLVEHTRTEEDGVITDVTKTYSSDGKLLKEVTTKTRQNHDHTNDSWSNELGYIYGPDGQLTGTVKSETVTLASGDHTSSGQTVSECDAKGENCTEVVTMTYNSDDDETDAGHDDPEDGGDGGESDHGTDDGATEYVNPDYSDDTVTYVQTLNGVTAVLGGNINPMRNWVRPGFDKDPNFDRLSAIAYVDETAGVYNTYFSVPRITTAQPEVVPGMPNPAEGAPPPNPGGCGGLC